ncbi:hypothetical protein [Edaphobacter dinghuensis]|nr:hypothetical protein [Edaphobacter dinghuensis]
MKHDPAIGQTTPPPTRKRSGYPPLSTQNNTNASATPATRHLDRSEA